MTELSPGPLLPESCRGTAKAASSDSIVEDEDAAPLEEAAVKGILGPAIQIPKENKREKVKWSH